MILGLMGDRASDTSIPPPHPVLRSPAVTDDWDALRVAFYTVGATGVAPLLILTPPSQSPAVSFTQPPLLSEQPYCLMNWSPCWSRP
jgi:hypothetical protein